MREILKNKRIVIMSILAIVVIIILVLNQTNIVETITNTIKNVMLAQQVNVETNAYYEVLSQNEEDLEILVTIENPNGIEKIVSGDTEYKCKGKQKVTFDRKMKEGEEQEYKITPVDGEEELYTMLAENKIKLIKYEKKEDKIYATLETTYNDNMKAENLYEIDENENWTKYEETFIVELDANPDEYIEKKITIKNNYEEGKSIQRKPVISAKVTNRMGIINEIASNMNEYEGANYEINKVDDVCTVHEYVIEGDKEIDSDTVYGDEEDIGKNMVIVKVNGNLTINKGITVTAVRK